jgi:hypothetical protein
MHFRSAYAGAIFSYLANFTAAHLGRMPHAHGLEEYSETGIFAQSIFTLLSMLWVFFLDPLL